MLVGEATGALANLARLVVVVVRPAQIGVQIGQVDVERHEVLERLDPLRVPLGEERGHEESRVGVEVAEQARRVYVAVDHRHVLGHVLLVDALGLLEVVLGAYLFGRVRLALHCLGEADVDGDGQLTVDTRAVHGPLDEAKAMRVSVHAVHFGKESGGGAAPREPVELARPRRHLSIGHVHRREMIRPGDEYVAVTGGQLGLGEERLEPVLALAGAHLGEQLVDALHVAVRLIVASVEELVPALARRIEYARLLHVRHDGDRASGGQNGQQALAEQLVPRVRQVHVALVLLAHAFARQLDHVHISLCVCVFFCYNKKYTIYVLFFSSFLTWGAFEPCRWSARAFVW